MDARPNISQAPGSFPSVEGVPGMTRQNITASNVHEADRLLNAAVEKLKYAALTEGGAGILVTRTGPGQFTVEVDRNVPYGITLEVAA
jgi:hypothetical protein